MMKYFAIESSLDENTIGKIPQVKEFIHHCNVDEEPNFIDKFIFEKIEINPILSNVILDTNAKKTDFIDTFGNVGFNYGYLISDKFKEILDKFNCFGIQFFPTYIVQQNEKFYNYWQTNIYDFPFHCIDFNTTKVFLKDGISRKIITELLEIHSLQDFKNQIDVLEFPISISLSNITFNEKMNLDFFTVRFFENGGHRGIVSERLKDKIEKEAITGIEFRPIELSLNEWLKPGGEREKNYGKT